MKTHFETMEEIERWVYDELEPYFQGEYGTMDSMLELFITQLSEKIQSAVTSAEKRMINNIKSNLNREIREYVRRGRMTKDIKNLMQTIIHNELSKYKSSPSKK